jgi:hypothetical protein
MSFGPPAETRMTPPPAVGSGVPRRATPPAGTPARAPRAAPGQIALDKAAGAVAANSGFVLAFSSGERIPVSGRGVIGRDPSEISGPYVQRIPLADTDKLLSRAHLEFGLDGSGSLWISDLHSTNGALVERKGQAPQRCLPGYRVAIQPGDRVTFGGRILTIESR